MRALLIAFLAAAPLAASDLVFWPPNPDSGTLIRMSYLDGCTASDPSVTVSGNIIDVALPSMPGVGGCVAAFVPIPVTFSFGPLPPGTYTVRFGGKPVQTLVVREAAPFTIAPYAVPTTGGTTVVFQQGGVMWPSLGVDSSVKIGDRVVFARGSAERLEAVVPPAQPGAVDVTLTTPYQDGSKRVRTYTARNALVYYDPAQPPDPSIAEPLLFPIAFDGPGAFGSQWHTENSLTSVTSGNSFTFPVFYRPPCDGCGTTLNKRKLTLPPMRRADGLLLWILRGTEQYAAASSQVRDLSRSESNAGVGIPVVRGEDFRRDFTLLDVPIEPGSRVLLRIWSLENAPSVEALVYGVIGGAFWSSHVTLLHVSDQQLLFGSVELPPATAKETVDLTVSGSLRGETIWPLVSVTNNQTQQVTIIAPPH